MIETVATGAALLLAIPAFVFATECVLGSRPIRGHNSGEAPPFAVLVPAHDEAAGISGIVERIVSQLRPHDRLLVIADNCTDDTAERARTAGATVVERSDPDRRGKGYALAFGRDALASAPPAVVIIMDADCWAEEGGLERIALEASRRSCALQASYRFIAPQSGDALVQISNFALLVKNKVRQRALARLGAPAILQGTGMGFPWSVFAQADLATRALAEDLEIGIDLVAKGHQIRWTESTTVWSKPASRESTLTQRTRWEHGFLSTATSKLPRLVRTTLATGSPGSLWLALDLLVPPLAMLVAVLTTAFLVSVLVFAVLGWEGPVSVFGAALSAVIFGTGLAWATEGRTVMPFSALLKAPLYVLWKLPIYARLLIKTERRWVRTARDD